MVHVAFPDVPILRARLAGAEERLRPWTSERIEGTGRSGTGSVRVGSICG